MSGRNGGKMKVPAKEMSLPDETNNTPTQTAFTTMGSKERPPILEETYKSFRLNCLQFVDSRKWHYFVMFLLFLDFFGNCVAVSFTSTENFYKYGKKARFSSAGFTLLYIIDMLLRIISLRMGLLRNAASNGDMLMMVLSMATLGTRFWKADDPNKVKITQGDWTNKYEIAHEYNSNQIEIYLTAVYCFLIAIRIVLKPRARIFSKKLHKYANHDNLRISMASLRASLRRIPGITAVAVEMMETDLVIICGRDDGDMSREELMQFLQKALLYRPKDLSANAFLAHLRDIDALSTHAVYGAYDVVKSTFRHWSNQRIDLFLTILVVIVFACVTPVLAYFLKLITDEGFPKNVATFSIPDDFDVTKIGYIYKRIIYKNESVDEDNRIKILKFVPGESLLTGMIGVVGISVPFILCDYAMGYFQAKMIAKATQKLQQSLLRVILHKPTKFFQERSDGDLNNLFQSDIARVNSMWQAVFWNLMQPTVAIVIGFGYLMYFEPIIGIMSFSFATVLVTSGPQGLAGDKSQDFGKKNAYVAAEFQNTISCQKIVRAYEIQNSLLVKFGISIRTLRLSQFAKDFWSGIVQIYIESAMFIFVSVMTACLAIKVYHGNITAGEFFASVTLLSRVSTPVTVLGGFMRVAIGNASSLQRLDDIVLGAEEIILEQEKQDNHKPALPLMKKAITLTNIGFSYTGEKTDLDNISAIFKQGEYICIVGPSGCGKSTLLNCLMQFQEISNGFIGMDGIDIKMYSKSSYMNQIATVFQDGGILNGTILENIRYGYPNATDQNCFDAAKYAECDEFILQLKDDYNTIIGQHGTANLSGGQIQRICLARALVRKPSVLLLDEATSALDPETEAHIVTTLEKLAHQMKMTVISVTHRLATTRNADYIMVLNEGKVLESGKFNELMNKPGSFFGEMMQKIENSNGDGVLPRATMENIYTMDMGNVLDTHRALNDFQQALNQRVDDNGDISSVWQTRKRSVSRGSRNNSLLHAKPRQSMEMEDRDSYIVM